MHLFTYGTLMALDIMGDVSGCALEGVGVILDGYERYGVRGEQYPGIIKADHGRVEGVLYYNVPPEALTRLDLFEGKMYSREPVRVVRKDDGKFIEAMAYVITPESAHMLTGKAWDFNNFIQNGKQIFEDLYSGFGEIKER